MSLLAVFAGLFSIAGAVLDWDWFFNNGRARPFVKMFGREGARAFYIALGLFLCAMPFLGILDGPPSR